MALALAEKIILRLEQRISERKLWDTNWQDVADYVEPTRQFTTRLLPGEELRTKIFDSTAPRACDELAGALHGLLMNPTVRWFALTLDDSTSDPNDRENQWLYAVTTQMLSVFANPSSGFGTSAHEITTDLCAFGTGIHLMLDRPTGIRFQARQLPNTYITENDDGMVVEIYRRLCFPANEVLTRWPATVSEDVRRKALDPNQSRDEVEVVHAVFQREDRDPERIDGPNKPWASIYVERSQKTILSIGGFDENPFMTPRWKKAPEENYGRSQTMMMMPTIKVLNAKVKTGLIAGEQAVRPPMLIPSNSLEGPLRTHPGAMIPVRAGTGQRPEPLDMGVRPDLAKTLADEDRVAIEKAYFLDIFTLPERDRMTATEVIERRQQGLIRVSPILSRQYEEWLTPIVTRTYRSLARRGLLPPAPDSLSGARIGVQYVSPMALAQRASESQAFSLFMNAATPLLNADPSALMQIDSKQAIRILSQQFNVDPRFMRTVDEAERLEREARDQAALQAQAETAGTAATAARDAAQGLKLARDIA